jgi:hypothetical protein
MIELHDRAKFEANSRSPKEENRIIPAERQGVKLGRCE